MTTPHPTDAPPVPADLDALAALCAAFPGPFALWTRYGSGEPQEIWRGDRQGSDDWDDLRITDGVLEDIPWIEAMLTRANAVPTLLAELATARAELTALRNERDALAGATTQPRLSPELAAALDKMADVYALFDSQSDPAFYEIAKTALIGWAVRAIDAYRAAKGAPADGA